jgi:hypothetical protein
MNGHWTPTDAAGLNEFLNTPLGRKWLGHLLASKPKIDMSSTEKAGISGAYLAGYEYLLFTRIGADRLAGAKDAPTFSKPGIDPEKD